MKAAVDTSVLLVLGKLGYLKLLGNLFDTLFLAQSVFEEISGDETAALVHELSDAGLVEIKNCSNLQLLNLLSSSLGKGEAETSALTFDEVFWAIKKLDFDAALEAAQALLNFPNLEIIPVDRELSLSALQIIKEYHLAPRDAIHAATAIAAKAEAVVSTDTHFDKIKELKRRSL